jgi:hypothetical protein
VGKKLTTKNPEKPRVRAKHKKVKLAVPVKRSKGWAALGFDLSTSSIAGCLLGYDATLDRFTGPHFLMRRWTKEDHYFSRLQMAAQAEEHIHDLLSDAKLFLELDEIYIAVEEPFPPHSGFTGRGNSQSLKQQAEISGAFLGGLMRYGYRELYQIGNHQWRKIIADDLGITIHHTKWKDPALAEIYNCKPTDTGKFRAKQWAFHELGVAPALAQIGFPEEIPDWPEIIKTDKDGKVPRPETSRAKALQPDDRYDALAMSVWMMNELKKAGVI